MVLLVHWYCRIEKPEIQSRIGIEYFSFEQRTMKNEKQKNQMKTKVEKKMNEKSNNKQNKQTTIINLHDVTYT